MKKVAQSLDDVVIAQRDAQRIVSEPSIQAAFEELKARYLTQWAQTTAPETERRELLYRNFKAVADVWGALERKANSAHVRDLKDAANG